MGRIDKKIYTKMTQKTQKIALCSVGSGTIMMKEKRAAFVPPA
nr:hypothetical protein [Anaerofilum sp. An201]